MAVLHVRKALLKRGEVCTVRSAVEADAQVLLDNARRMMEEPFNVTTPDEFDVNVDQERAWIVAHREKPGWLAIVAEVDGVVIGLLNFENGGRARIAHRGTFGMSVLPAWQERGVGTALLAALLGWAEAHPTIEKVVLAVVEGNHRAVALYEKYGFLVSGRNPREVKYGEDDYRDDLVMYRFVDGR